MTLNVTALSALINSQIIQNTSGAVTPPIVDNILQQMIGTLNQDAAAYKTPVAVATTAAIDGSMTGLPIIDGYQTVLNDRILVWQNTDNTTNGIYVAQAGAWTRAPDFSDNTSIANGTQVFVTHGSTYDNFIFNLTTAGQVGAIVPGTSHLTFAAVAPVTISAAMEPVVQASTIAVAQGLLGISSSSAAASILNALNFGVTGDGTTNDAAAINTFLTTCITDGAIAYFPDGKTFNLGSSSITVPDYSTVICGRNATFLRTADPAGNYAAYTSAMIIMGNHCNWNGGVLNNTTTIGTSTTSNTISGSNVTFTVAAGLPITPGTTFLRVAATGAPQNAYEGTVTSYSGTTLVINSPFHQGSGTFSAWTINVGSVYQCPMVLHGVTETIVQNVRITGLWYVGIILDGWNPAGGGSLTVTDCSIVNCYAESVQNRGFYLYGTCTRNLFSACVVEGNSGVTNYGFNCNPANPSGSVNSQLTNRIANCTVNATAFQGIAFGDNCQLNVVTGCIAQNLTDSSGVGFLSSFANGNAPQYNRFENCIALACPGEGFAFIGTLYGGAEGCSAVTCGVGYLLSPSGSNQTTFVGLTGCEAIGSTASGFQAVGNSNRCDLNDIKAVANGVYGIRIDTGAQITIVNGRASANTTAPFNDNGTGTVSTGLVTA